MEEVLGGQLWGRMEAQAAQQTAGKWQRKGRTGMEQDLPKQHVGNTGVHL